MMSRLVMMSHDESEMKGGKNSEKKEETRLKVVEDDGHKQIHHDVRQNHLKDRERCDRKSIQ